MRSESQKNRGVGKRRKRGVDDLVIETRQHSMVAMPGHPRVRRELEELRNIGKNRGTNIQMIRLRYDAGVIGQGTGVVNNGQGKLPKEMSVKDQSPVDRGLSSGSISGIVLAVLFLLILVAAVVFYKRRRPSNEVKRTASSVSVGDQDGTEI